MLGCPVLPWLEHATPTDDCRELRGRGLCSCSLVSSQNLSAKSRCAARDSLPPWQQAARRVAFTLPLFSSPHDTTRISTVFGASVCIRVQHYLESSACLILWLECFVCVCVGGEFGFLLGFPNDCLQLQQKKCSFPGFVIYKFQNRSCSGRCLRVFITVVRVTSGGKGVYLILNFLVTLHL